MGNIRPIRAFRITHALKAKIGPVIQKMEKISYYYECDYCGLKKNIVKTFGDRTDHERDLLKEGWIFLSSMDVTTFGRKKTSCTCGGSFLKGHYCSFKCFIRGITRRYEERMRT
jgi:hypothetical protein